MEFDQLTKIIEIAISIIGILLTILTIYLGVKQIKSAFKESKHSNRLQLADDLISDYMQLIKYSSKSFLYIVACANGSKKEMLRKDKNYPSYPQKHAAKLEEIKTKILAHGSTGLIQLFFDSYSIIQNNMNLGRGDMDSYKGYFFLMPLIASCIKYDLTGELVNPSTIYYCVMEEIFALEKAIGMETFREEMINKNNALVKKYKLTEQLLWIEQ